jgi:hypothetical protein
MATLGEVKSKETKRTLLGSHKTMPFKKLPVKNIISNIQTSVITDPIDPKRISKTPRNSLSVSSVIKAGLVFAGAIGSYYLAKTTGIFSYFGWGEKNLKDIGNKEMVSAKKSLSVRTNLETTRQVVNNPSVNRNVQMYKNEDKTVKFEEAKVKNFKNLLEVEKEKNVGMRKTSSRKKCGDAKNIFSKINKCSESNPGSKRYCRKLF